MPLDYLFQKCKLYMNRFIQVLLELDLVLVFVFILACSQLFLSSQIRFEEHYLFSICINIYCEHE